MGFIDYHGTKEDRFSEVLDYAHAQQEEDWKRKQATRIKKWLYDLTGDSSLADWYIQDLLKSVMVNYRELRAMWQKMVNDTDTINGHPSSQIWRDFSMEYVMRHIEPFHMNHDKRNKHFDTFRLKIFKMDGCDSAEIFYENITQKTGYRRYLTEAYDPTWKDQQFFKYLNSVAGNDREKKGLLDKLLSTYKALGISTALYLYQAAQPHDSGWMMQEAAEWNAVSELEKRISIRKLSAPEARFFDNPLYDTVAGRSVAGHDAANKSTDAGFVDSEDNDAVITKSTSEENASRTYDDVAADLPKSKLKKKEFYEYIEKGGIPNIVNACLLVLECDLPEEIRTNYEQLVSRLPVLKDAVDKFDETYHADLEQFHDYYAPETLKVTATYLDYQAVAPSERILQETREGVLIGSEKLLQVVNEKIDEIYKFVTIETKAEAKALEAIMNQYGYINPEFKIH